LYILIAHPFPPKRFFPHVLRNVSLPSLFVPRATPRYHPNFIALFHSTNFGLVPTRPLFGTVTPANSSIPCNGRLPLAYLTLPYSLQYFAIVSIDFFFLLLLLAPSA